MNKQANKQNRRRRKEEERKKNLERLTSNYIKDSLLIEYFFFN